MPMTPPSFAMVLRKHLKNARLTKVEQVGFDRVLMFRFDTKHGQRSLSVELFRNGNVILMDENDVIIQPLTHASYSGRTIKKGETYVPPPARLTPTALRLNRSKKRLMNPSETSFPHLVAKSTSEASMQTQSANMQVLSQTVPQMMQMHPLFWIRSSISLRNSMPAELAISFSNRQRNTMRKHLMHS